MSSSRLGALAIVIALTIAGCSGGSSGTIPSEGALANNQAFALAESPATTPIGTYIKHVIIVIQENRSFDNLFGTFPGADGATTGKQYGGKTVKLVKSPLYDPMNFPNGWSAYLTEVDNGKMDGFNLPYVNSVRCNMCAYQYVDPNDIAPYWSMAKQYVLADHMFPSEGSGSFSAHQDLIRGDSEYSSDSTVLDFPTHGPWGCDAAAGTTVPLLMSDGKYVQYGPFPCFTYTTLRDLLDAKSISWRYYAPQIDSSLAGAYWDAFEAIHAVRYSPEWTKNIVSPETTLLSDIAKGKLASVTWVVPDNQNSDHAGLSQGVDNGPSWVASIVNAVGKTRNWKSTAIIVVWDDWGGMYDHVPPPKQWYAGLGIRVPALIISPYAKTNYVSHTFYQFGSIVRFVEDTFDLGRLGTTDSVAKSLIDSFDFTQSARKFVPIQSKRSIQFFLHQRPSGLPPDTN